MCVCFTAENFTFVAYFFVEIFVCEHRNPFQIQTPTERTSINRHRWLLLLLLLSCNETLDCAASTFDFSTVGIKEIVEPWGLGHAPRS